MSKQTKEDLYAKAVQAGKKLCLPTVDFSDPDRPLTCLEVDFPILPINSISAIEGNAGKPIYQMSKWWARRRSSVFRSILLAAATAAPNDNTNTAKLVWDSYYANHQDNAEFAKLKVADIFMGGGTTIVEGLRLGFQMFGNDLNPVAHFIVQNEVANVDKTAVEKLLQEIEDKVKPEIQPYYTCDCPRCSNTAETIYTFWGKHVQCTDSNCGHYTPIMSKPVFAIKELTVKAYLDQKCEHCDGIFDLELQDVHIAPTSSQLTTTSVIHIVSENEKPFAVFDNKEFTATCPHCKKKAHFNKLEKAVNKKIEFTMLVHPDYLKGIDAATAPDVNQGLLQQSMIHPFIEYRGKLPQSINVQLAKENESHEYDTQKATVPQKAHFICAKCGLQQDMLSAVRKLGHPAPFVPYAIQGYCPECDKNKQPYGGRFFAIPDVAGYNNAIKKYKKSQNKIAHYIPKQSIPIGKETDRLPKHQYTHWYQMFNPRQLLGLATLLKTIDEANATQEIKNFVLGTFQDFIQYECMFTLWSITRDHMSGALMNGNFYP
ncbi:MAG: hypothetical protein LBH59_09385, partial [Planctomycetaceae bacterium]|nr:hypothetical protein [Planctomycetaceae bacterium]